MQRQSLFILIIALSVWALPLSAEEIATERPNLREPKYQTDQPLYCGLRFDKTLLKAKRDVVVWMVMDGNHLYIDKNANGDLTEPGEKLMHKPDPGNKTQFTHPLLKERFQDVTIRWWMAEANPNLDVSLLVDGQFVLGSIQEGAKSMEKAPVILVSDELRLFVFDDVPRIYLWTGKNARTILSLSGVSLGTKSSTGHYAYVEPESLPNDVYPVAEIQYAPKNPGNKPPTQLAEIDGRGMGYFIGGATVPQETPPGPITVTIKMSNWRSDDVKPVTVKTTLPEFKDLPVQSPK
ncbi:MAG: hypothetical protein KDA84_11250 [Planctomycetaceae bacterium]|nr:hypothetical protein [Planctomycetaceae bacterium]